jgi:hypothetical protein
VESWWDEATATVGAAYDSAAAAVSETWAATTQVADAAYDSAATTVSETWTATTQAAGAAYDSAATAVEQVWADVSGVLDDVAPWAIADNVETPSVCEDPPEEPDAAHVVLGLSVHGAFEVLAHVLHVGGKALPAVSMIVMGYEFVTFMGEQTAFEQARQLCGEYYELLLQQANAGECPQAFRASCNADHDGSGWSGPLRMSQSEAADDLNAHIYDWPDHEIVEGDATVTPLPDEKYAAGCNADHDGTAWSGPLRESFDEAADDLVGHMTDWPDHQLNTDDGRPGARVRTLVRDAGAQGGYR